MDTLKEHLTRIAKKHQKDLRKKLGAKKYRKYMTKLSLKAAQKRAKNKGK